MAEEVLGLEPKRRGGSPSSPAVERVAWYLQCPGGKEEGRDSIFVPWQWSSLNTCPSSAFWLWLLDMVGKIAPRHKTAGHLFSVSLHGM